MDRKVKVERKVLIVALVAVLTIGCIITLFMADYQNKVKDYVTVEATITEVYKQRTRTSRKSSKWTTYVRYTYSYKGKEYSDSVKVTSNGSYKEGKTEKIKINPNNPSEVESKRNFMQSILMVMVCACFSVYLIIAIIRYKK